MELEKYRENEKLAKEKATAEKAAEARKQQMREEEEAQPSDSDSDPSDDSESEDGGVMEMKKQMEGMDWTAGEQEDVALKQMSFDIYVKGHLTKAANFFKKDDASAPRLRLFPFVEKRRRFDDFGEVIDVSAWLRKGRVLDQNAESDEAKALRLKNSAEVKQVSNSFGHAPNSDIMKAPEEVPSKYITAQISIQMKCKVFFVDLEGVQDGRALKNILPHVNPRRLVRLPTTLRRRNKANSKQIIVQASSEATDSLVEACKITRSMNADIFTPTLGETIRIGEDMRNFTIALSDATMSSVKMSAVCVPSDIYI